jgi:VanZ family protein
MVSDTAPEKITPSSESHPTPHPSVFSRASLLAYVLLIVYASLYPFSGWQHIGLPLESYLFAPMPRYWTGFDVAVNVAAYVPLGVLIVFSLYPAIRGVWAVLLATALGVLVSGAMESVQTLLPNRVASNLDLLTNSAGALLGALLGAYSSRALLERSRLRRLRHHWFSAAASRGLIVLALWPLAQIYPQSYFFGNGQVLPILSDWVSDWLAMPVDLGGLLRQGAELTVEQYWLSEAVITMSGMAGALLALLCMMRDKAPKALLALILLAAAIIVKSLATALLFTPENAFAWLTPGARTGIAFGGVLVAGMMFLSVRAQRRMAVAMLALGLIVVNAAPANPYFIATLEAWVQGKFLNFNGAAQFLSLLWPFSALWFLLHPIHRLKRI